MKLKEKPIISYIIILFEMFELTYVTSTFISIGVANIPKLWVCSVSADCMSMGVGIMLLFCACQNEHYAKIGHFNALVVAVTVTSGIDALSWLTDGTAVYEQAIVINTLLFFAVSTCSYLFYLFIIKTITGRAPELKLLTGVLTVFYIIQFGLVVANAWKGFFFYIDESMVYHRGIAYPLSFIYPVGTEWVATSITMKHRMPLRCKWILILCCLTPTIASAVSATFYGVGIIYSSIQMMLVIVYSIFFAEMDFNSAKLRARYENQVSNQVVNKLVDSKTGSILRTRRNHVTILYCHVRNFDEVAKTMTAQEKTALLNRYFTRLVKLAEHRDGVLLDFINNNLLFIFGAPERSEKHAEKAIAAALEMQCEFMADAEADKKQLGGLRLSITINTDYILVGSVGNEDQLQFTTISDDLNYCKGIDEHAADNEVLVTYDTVQEVHVPLGYGPRASFNTDRRYFDITACSVLGIEGPYKIRMPSVMK